MELPDVLVFTFVTWQTNKILFTSSEATVINLVSEVFAKKKLNPVLARNSFSQQSYFGTYVNLYLFEREYYIKVLREPWNVLTLQLLLSQRDR